MVPKLGPAVLRAASTHVSQHQGRVWAVGSHSVQLCTGVGFPRERTSESLWLDMVPPPFPSAHLDPRVNPAVNPARYPEAGAVLCEAERTLQAG